MKKTDLAFNFPENLIATSPERPSRVMWVGEQGPEEISIENLLARVSPGDVWVLNDTQVLRRRVFAGDRQDLEILFLKKNENQEGELWEVLFPSKAYKIGDILSLPEGVSAELVQKGRPQVLKLSAKLEPDYFDRVGELPLPPYIQKAREERHTVDSDQHWYQTAWSEKPGSLAAPTASLHFSEEHLRQLQEKGVEILKITLHVGLGTFLPVTADNLQDHSMHFEEIEVSAQTWKKICQARQEGKKIWALGTTVARSLESVALGLVAEGPVGFRGLTNLLILPGHRWQAVDVLMTNFHQPESTLLALVAAFSSLTAVKTCYQWAIDRKFRLFSYGDLSIWQR